MPKKATLLACGCPYQSDFFYGQLATRRSVEGSVFPGLLAGPACPVGSCSATTGGTGRWAAAALQHRLSIFSSDNIHRSIFHTSSDRAAPSDAASDLDVAVSGYFGFSRLLGLSPGQVLGLAQATALEWWAFYWQREAAWVQRREIC